MNSTEVNSVQQPVTVPVVVTANQAAPIVAPSPRTISLLGVDVQPFTMDEAVSTIIHWTRQPSLRCRFVVTPNVDHIVMLQENEKLRAAYRSASMTLVDGWPVVLASKLLKTPVPTRVAGSDLVPAVFQRTDQISASMSSSATHSQPALTVYFLGAAPGVGARAAERIESQWPNVRVVGHYSPPLGFEKDQVENDHILNRIAAVNPDILIVGLGAPKQELWVHAHHDQIQAKVALCVGATIDFLAGEKNRAPTWMQRCGLEWFHRMASEPRRLAKRYLRDAWIFPRIVLRHFINHKRQRDSN